MITQYQAAQLGKVAFELFKDELLKQIETEFNELKNIKEEKQIKNDDPILNQELMYNYQEIKVSSDSSNSPKIYVNPKIDISSPKIEKISKLNDDITKITNPPNSNIEFTVPVPKEPPNLKEVLKDTKDMRFIRNPRKYVKERKRKFELRGGKSEIELINWANNPKNYRR